MYIVSEKKRIPVQSVDGGVTSGVKESFKIPGLGMEIDPFMMIVLVLLVTLVIVFIYLMMTKEPKAVAQA
jgi:hypothetical protein